MTPAPDASGWNTTPVTVTFTGADTLSGIASCTPPVTFNNNGAGQVATGTCTDKAGNSTTVSQTVNIRSNTVIDPAGPQIQGIPTGPCILWSPNGQMVRVATLSVSPGQGASLTVTAASDQPADPGDIRITGTVLQWVVQLRAQRSGSLGDRTYTVTATAADSAGNTTIGQFTCTVPHDQRTGN